MRKVFLLSSLFAGFLTSLTAQDVFPLRPGDPGAKELADPLVDLNENRLSKQMKSVKESALKVTLTPAFEPKEERVQEFVIQSGGSLSKVSAEAYGRLGYWRVLKLYNGIDTDKLTIGQVIKAPDLLWLLKKEKVVPFLKDAVDDLMAGRAKYMEVEDVIRPRVKGSDKITPSEEDTAKLLEAKKLIANASAKFGEPRKGINGAPNSTLLQLRIVGELIGEIADGTSKTGDKMTLVHHHLGNALTYCIIWAREGFS
jgi:LysM repeat protein